MKGELIDCPNCGKTIEVSSSTSRTIPQPARTPTPKLQVPPPRNTTPLPQPKSPTQIEKSASSQITAVLTAIIVILVVTLGVAGFFGYRFWQNQEQVKREQARTKQIEPFSIAAKEAMDAANKMQSGLEVGLNHNKYCEMLIEYAAKLDNLNLEYSRVGADALPEAAFKFKECLNLTRQALELAKAEWDSKLKYGNDYTDHDGNMQQAWGAASKGIAAANMLFGPAIGR